MGLKTGDRVRVRNAGTDDDGRTGRVLFIDNWYGSLTATVLFDTAGWDQSVTDSFYLSELEILATDALPGVRWRAQSDARA